MRSLERALIQPGVFLRRENLDRERKTEDVQRIDHVRTQQVSCGVFSWRPCKTNTPAELQSSPFEICIGCPLSQTCCLCGLRAPASSSTAPHSAFIHPDQSPCSCQCVVPCRPSHCLCCVLCREACSPTWQLPSLLQESFPSDGTTPQGSGGSYMLDPPATRHVSPN